MFVLKEFQIVDRPMSGRERKQVTQDSSRTCQGWTRREEKWRREKMIFFAIWAMCYLWLLFFQNLHKFRNSCKTFLQVQCFHCLIRLIYSIINPILVWKKGMTLSIFGRRKKQGLQFQDRHPKKKKTTKVDCLVCKAILSK